MGKPVVLAVGDPRVLRAVARDPGRRYARGRRVMRSGPGELEPYTPGKSKQGKRFTLRLPLDAETQNGG